MRKLLKNLVALWMVLAIALPPVQAFSAAAPARGGDACASHTAAAAGPHAGHRADAQAGGACPHCAQQDCDQNDCSGGNCSGVHLQPALPFSVAAQPHAAAAAADALPAGGILSRSDPPPLRPPL